MDGEAFWRRIAVSELADCWEWMGWRDTDGYGRVSQREAYEGGRYAHRIAWMLTNGPMSPELCVCHTCDNPACCNPRHLWLGTNIQNIADRENKGRTARAERSGRQRHPDAYPRGSAHPSAKLREADIIAVRARYRDTDITAVELAAEYGVSRTSMQWILHGRTWRHVPDAVASGECTKPLRGERNGRAKLTAEQVGAIRTQHAAGGVTKRQIAAAYGVTDVLIGLIVRGQAWKE